MQSNTGVGGSCKSFSGSQRGRSGPPRVVCMAPSSRSNDRNGSVAMETKLNGINEDAVLVDGDNKQGAGAGGLDIYSDGTATEEEFITPWNVSVAR